MNDVVKNFEQRHREGRHVNLGDFLHYCALGLTLASVTAAVGLGVYLSKQAPLLQGADVSPQNWREWLEVYFHVPFEGMFVRHPTRYSDHALFYVALVTLIELCTLPFVLGASALGPGRGRASKFTQQVQAAEVLPWQKMLIVAILGFLCINILLITLINENEMNLRSARFANLPSEVCLLGLTFFSVLAFVASANAAFLKRKRKATDQRC